MPGRPALILGHRTDILASNNLARALFAGLAAMPAKHRNYARWMLLDEDARDLFIDWEEQARNAVEALRLDSAARGDDRGLQQLIGELSIASSEFRRLWSVHRVHQRTHGTKQLRHPVAGALDVQFGTLAIPSGEPVRYLYTTEPGSSSEQGPRLLTY